MYVKKTRYLGLVLFDTSACPINTLPTITAVRHDCWIDKTRPQRRVGMIPDVGTGWGGRTRRQPSVPVWFEPRR